MVVLMVKRIPQTLLDLLSEEPDRIVSYLDLDKIKDSDDPLAEFIHQFEIKFNTEQGLNLWKWVVLEPDTVIKPLFNSKEIQSRLPHKTRYTPKTTQTYVHTYEEKAEKKVTKYKAPKRRPKKYRVVQVNAPQGKYYRKEAHIYTPREVRFITNHKDYPLAPLAYEFNKTFGTQISKYGIRDKRLRLLGKKK